MSSSLTESLHLLRPMFDLVPNAALNASSSPYSHVFGFERVFQSDVNAEAARHFMVVNWPLSLLFASVYCLLVFVGRRVMSDRPRFEARRALILWNILLASFSILGTIRVLPEFRHMLAAGGLTHSVCDGSYAYGIAGFWAFMFCLSKLPELVDTLFIVIRKQQLIFLHWYHHATVLVYCWFSYKDFTSTGRWFMVMNYFVHSMMYTYYACKAMRMRVPAFVSQLITTSQILQMVAGCYVNYVAYQANKSGVKCATSNENILYSSLMYFSYFVLFFHFFINAYILKSGRKVSSSLSPREKQATTTNSNTVRNDFKNNIRLQDSLKEGQINGGEKLKKRN